MGVVNGWVAVGVCFADEKLQGDYPGGSGTVRGGHVPFLSNLKSKKKLN